jgi:CheY-like chemotaxis protein
MNKFHVLFLEDLDDDRHPLMEALSGAEFHLVHFDNWESAATELRANRFDLVIADMMIHEKANRTVKEVGHFNCIPPLLDITESIAPPIPVIIYTSKADLSSLTSFQPRIVDFWEKPQRDIEFIQLRVRKIRDLIERERPNSLLIRAVRAGIERSITAFQSPPWHVHILQVLSDYEEYNSKTDQADAILSPLSEIASELGFASTFRDGFQVLTSVDMPSSLLLSTRPHLHHSLNNFLLGYYYFNLCGIEWQSILAKGVNFYQRSIERSIREGMIEAEASSKAWLEINAAWFAAALLHDVGITIQYYGSMEKKLRDLVSKLNISESFPSVSTIKLDSTIVESAMIDIGRCCSKEIVEFLKDLKGTPDQGIASAAYLTRHCRKEVEATISPAAAEFVDCGAAAAALHNSLEKPNFPTLDFSVEPVASMLIICDAIQAWDRERLDFGLLSGGDIQRVELSELKWMPRTKSGPIIDAVVRYFPHLSVAHHRPTMDKCESRLREVLQKHVTIPLRQKLVFGGAKEFTPKFRIHFKLGQRTITTLSIPD